MVNLIHDHKSSEKKEEKRGLFNSLLDANDDEKLSEGEVKLSTKELIGALFYCPVDLVLLNYLTS